ncbi:MAG: cobyric acid synthase [Actinomycetota bacterium]
MRGALLVAGTSSDTGKSVVVAGICRWLARRGVRVAPFKAQNMSMNSAVTPEGAEIGRAQFAQAQAARVVPEAAMNPILLKPSTDRSSQVVVMGRPLTNADARGYLDLKSELLPVALEALESLRSRFDVVVCEGAGSLAEINLREGDLSNMGLARAAHLPVVVVAGIDRGGAIASLFGSLALLDSDDQALVGGFLLNKFRGDLSILQPGIDELAELTGRPTLGVLPWVGGLWLDAEDSVALDGPRIDPAPPLGPDAITVAVIRLPRISNFTDADALAAEPGVMIRFTESFAEVTGADLVVLPGTKATVEDLRWLRSRGLDEALEARAVQGHPLIGICGGYQMLGRQIVDRVESQAGEVNGLGLLPVETGFSPNKLLGNPTGIASGLGGVEVSGYEIRHGRVRRLGGDSLFATAAAEEGCRVGPVLGTSWHGVFESDAFRRVFLQWVAEVRGLDWVPGSRPFAEIREARLDLLGDLIDRHADIDALVRLAEEGPPAELPFVRPGVGFGPSPSPAEASEGLLAPSAVPADLRLHGDRMVPPGHLDFAVNVLPEGPPDWLRKEMDAALDRISSYPEESEAILALAERHERSADEVLPTNGAADAFWLLAAALLPRHAVVVHPTFTEPEAALRAFGRHVERAFRRPDDFALDPRAVSEDADLVVLGNPNNPTGTLDPARVLERLVRPGRVLVVDEAFMNFVPGESESMARRADIPGLVVVRSLTKAWSLPGLRAGYLVGPADLVRALWEMRQPWSVNTVALAALTACARDRITAEKVAAEVAVARDALMSALSQLSGVRVWPSAANFLLVRVTDGPSLRARLLERGIGVRRCETFPGLTADHLRIAVRRPEQNRLLLDALGEVVG